MRQGGCRYGVAMLTMEAMGNGKGGWVERLGFGKQGERNRRHWYDHQWDIVLVFLYLLPLSFYPLSYGVSCKSTLRIQVLGWLYIELPPTLNTGTWRSSSVRNHGISSILGVKKETHPDEDAGESSKCITGLWGDYVSLTTGSVRQKWKTRTSGTVDQIWSWMTICCSKSSWTLSYSILRWSYRP